MKVRDQFKIEHIALNLNKQGLYFCSKGWSAIHEADRYLIEIQRTAIITDQTSIISDVPIYLTHTSFVEDFSSIGYLSYRLIIV